MGKIKAVIFDLDGTLINSIYDLADSVNYVLSKYSYPTRQTDEYYYLVGNGALKLIERALPKEVSTTSLALKLREDFITYYRQHSLDKTVLYDGIKQTLDAIKLQNIKTAVVTNKPHAQAQSIADHFLKGYFEQVCGQQDNMKIKPDPAATLFVMEKLGVKPSECLFVGDSGVDMQTGVNSGAIPVGVLWGFRTKQELEQNGAKYIISKPYELLNIIGEINERK